MHIHAALHKLQSSLYSKQRELHFSIFSCALKEGIMVFCGHCGYQLHAGNTACPRCGTPTEPIAALDDSEADSPTIASHTMLNAPQAMPPQQPLILRSPDGSFGAVDQQGGTNRAGAPGYADIAPAYNPNVRTPYPGPAQGASYPGLTSQGSVDTSMPGFYGTTPATTRTRGRNIVLVLILLVLLLASGAIAVYLFIIRPSTPPPPPTSSQQAQAVLQQFYENLNKRDYQSAYNLLGQKFQQGQSFSNFAGGYAHTQHDDFTFDSITPLADGTVKVVMTINATEDAASGAGVQHSVYKGSYVVGQENGMWKILSGNLNKVA